MGQLTKQEHLIENSCYYSSIHINNRPIHLHYSNIKRQYLDCMHQNMNGLVADFITCASLVVKYYLCIVYYLWYYLYS